MNLRRTLITLAGAATAAAVALPAGASLAWIGDPAMPVLDELCEARGGLPVLSPYAIGRCQGARANKGFELEALVCADLADGRFVVSIDPQHMNRANWACIATS